MRRSSLILLACWSAVSLSPASPAKAADSADETRFKALYTREWAWRKQQEAASENTNAISPHLPDVSAATQQKKLAYWTDVMRELGGIAPARLSVAGREDYAVYRAQIDALLTSQRFRDYEKPLNADSSFWSDLAYVSRQPFKTEADYINYLSQLAEMPRYFDQQVANMRAGLARHFTPPKFTLEGRDSSLTSVTEAGTPEANPYYAPFKQMPASIAPARQAELRAQAVKTIGGSVIPAHRALLDFMRGTYIPGAVTTTGAEAWPDGRAYYESKVREYATEDVTPDQVHAIGLVEVAKIRAQMMEVMRDAKFQGDLPAFLTFLRTDKQFYATTPEQLLKEAAYIAKEFDGKAATWFGHLPRQRFAIKPVPADIAPFYTSGRGGPGIYLVNTYNLPARALYSLAALTLHESAPGHAFQMPLAAENQRQPEFRREVYISAFGEGWALYCEKLGDEMGMYKTPYDRFGMLSYQMWRAARLVVDTGVHHLGWSREKARQYLHDNTALADHEIETEVDRYIAWPGQAISYYLGERAILEERAKAEKALGAKFDIRHFHDAVLELGSAPIPVIRARIDRFIAEGGPTPYKDDPAAQ